jgi:ADP-ribosylation factor-like protein 4
MEEAKMELARTARAPENQGVPVVVLANKQDLPGAREPHEIEKLVGLTELATTHPLTCVVPACAITGEGLHEALDTLYQMILKRRKLHKQTKKRNR